MDFGTNGFPMANYLVLGNRVLLLHLTEVFTYLVGSQETLCLTLSFTTWQQKNGS